MLKDFFYPYTIGLLSKLFKIDIYIFYRVLVVLTLIIINIILISILKKLKKNSLEILICLFLVNFNPYISRFYISNPLMLNDLIFILGCILSCHALIYENKKSLLISLIIASLARQSALAIPISLLF